jgi:3-deoxy-D-manno-octulosonate 8-phosphate phosphatase (KDO 8-P phosphatase)
VKDTTVGRHACESRHPDHNQKELDSRLRGNNDLTKRAKKIKLVIFDVDGVMTDGRLYFDPQGNELKVFHVHDGLGIKLLQTSGVKVAVITSRQSLVVKQRLTSLGIQYIYQGQHNKYPVFQQLMNDLQLSAAEIAYVGDDLPDLPIIQHVGLGIAVANARDTIKQHAAWQTTLSGGAGAVREVCELIMQAQGTLDTAYKNYF